MTDSPLPPGLLRDVIMSPDRLPGPGQIPICSLNGEETPEELQAIAPWTRERLPLSRRGVSHGEWLVCEPEALGDAPAPPLQAVLEQHWFEARPIQVNGWAPPADPERTKLAFETLWQDKGLRAYLGERLAALGQTFAPGSNMHLVDAERDRERIRLGQDHDLWVKSSPLSTRAGERSLRVRHSFGKEVEEDASRDIERHRMVAEFAAILWPEVARFPQADPLSQALEEWMEGPVLRTQHIAYFNAPDGGALWHHDAFDEPLEGGQRGVLYAQLSGRTAWLACPIDYLCKRVMEYLEYLQEGELGWVLEETRTGPAKLERLSKMATRFKRMRREIGLPGQGAFGSLLGRGEFTALCADAGHAYLLGPGDALLLPNHGLESTVMHSVFCASAEPGLAISMALRQDQETPQEPERRGDQRDGYGGPRSGRRHRGRRRA